MLTLASEGAVRFRHVRTTAMKVSALFIAAMLTGTATAVAAPALRDSNLSAIAHENVAQVNHRPVHPLPWTPARIRKPSGPKPAASKRAGSLSGGLNAEEIRVRPLSDSTTRTLRNHRECTWRHYSYNRASGTFTGRDGFQHFCP
jgi:hypothetical protein